MGGENLRFVQNFKGELVGITKERGAVYEVSRRRVEAGGAERWAKSLRLTKRFTSSVGIRRHLPLKGKAKTYNSPSTPREFHGTSQRA